MKYISTIIWCCVFSFNLRAQLATARLDSFSILNRAICDRQHYDSLPIIHSQFSKLPNLNYFELQYLDFQLGDYYKIIKQKQKSVLYYKKSLSISKPDEESVQLKSVTLATLADLYFTHQQYDTAFVYANEASKLITPELQKFYVDVHSIIGYYYYEKGNYQKSLQEYELANQQLKGKKSLWRASVISKKAKTISKLGNATEAIELAKESIDIAIERKDKEQQLNFTRTLFDIYKENNELKKAIEVLNKIELLDNEVNLEQRNKALDEAEIKFQSKLKDADNKTLKIINEAKEQVVKKQTYALIIAGIAIIIIIIISALLYKLSKQRKKINIELSLSKYEIELQNKDLERQHLLNQKIFSVISHDFKGPISTLKSMISRKDLVNSDNELFNMYIKDISSQLNQSDEIIESLLNWAKNELNISINKAILSNVYELTEKIIQQLKQQTETKNLTISNEIDKALKLKLPPDVLTIVLRNLISNAIKFSYNSTVIYISNNGNNILVKDSGQGIDKKQLERLFVKQVASYVGTQHEAGFGIGLYMSNELLTKYNAKITAKNNDEGGCTFEIKTNE